MEHLTAEEARLGWVLRLSPLLNTGHDIFDSQDRPLLEDSEDSEQTWNGRSGQTLVSSRHTLFDHTRNLFPSSANNLSAQHCSEVLSIRRTRPDSLIQS